MATNLGWIVLGLPLLGALILSLWPDEPPAAVTRLVGVGSIFVSFVLTAVIFFGMLGDDASERTHVDGLWEWIAIGDLRLDLSIQIDPLSVLMMLVITGVGFLIHLYSVGYMDGSRSYRRFFAEMNFFVFSMLLLVQAANFVFLIVGWAFVGLASYLLIGFDHDRPAAVAAAKKAFVINVIGDIGMVIAAWIILREVGALDYATVFTQAEGALGAGSYVAEAVALLLFVGAAAKSAQVPLHTWLPDAMEGPTPVSALIHAATMVTAGVYLVVRTHALYEIAPTASDVVAVIGAITLLMAATIAIAQVDIKRVLAWSTVSQIGYMIMGAGLGAYAGAMFHFLTHAFFKALLFLAAGIVIHALGGEQSLDRMGGLKHHMRLAYFAIGVGCLAIAGIPGLSGFFSKDEILASALEAGTLGVVLWVVGTVAAGLTAFYMFRLLFRAFHGQAPEGVHHHPHPTAWVMSVPVAVLAVLAAIGGWLQVPGGWGGIRDWLEPVLADVVEPLEPSHGGELLTAILSTAVALVGIGAAYWLFAADPSRGRRLSVRLATPRGVLEDAYRVDDMIEGAVIQPGRDLGDVLLNEVEPKGVSGAVQGTVELVRDAALGLRALQTGLVRTYVWAMAAGAILVAVIMVLVR